MIITLIILILILISYKALKRTIPQGTSVKSEMRNSEVEFIYDLSYKKDGAMVYEQNIFSKIQQMVKEAQEFIVIDMFLFNDDYDRKSSYKDVSKQLTEALIQKKKDKPDIEIVFITDEINSFYGSYTVKYLERLKTNHIQVVITDLEKLRDPNLIYSGFWRLFLSKLPINKKAWLPNPFSPDSPKATLTSYLKLLNMKANHRKVIITENQGLVTSLNVHDASSNHSNIALAVKGEIVNDLLETENAIIKFSGGKVFNFKASNFIKGSDRAQVLTEKKIKEVILEEIQKTKKADQIKIVMFYLSDFQVIEELLRASKRGVEIRIVLDANKDAFGRQKNGIPNRQVAYKLINDSKGKIDIRWYSTHGEQFHSKALVVSKAKETIVIGERQTLHEETLKTII